MSRNLATASGSFAGAGEGGLKLSLADEDSDPYISLLVLYRLFLDMGGFLMMRARNS